VCTMKGLFWVGPRESDIFDTGDLFEGSITLFGSNQGNNQSYSSTAAYRINHNIITQEQTDFANSRQLELLSKRDDVHFMSYNPYLVVTNDKKIQAKALCRNNMDVMRLTNDKIQFREWVKNYVHTLNSTVLKASECNYYNLLKKYKTDTFVIQANIASGGCGTFILDRESYDSVDKLIEPEQNYLVSSYVFNNIPVNIHLIIYKQKVVLSPASIQIMNRSNNKLLYRGADFISYLDIDEVGRKDFEYGAYEIGKELQKLGYRGVCGIDALITENKAYFLEVNNRFQASTPLINKAFMKAGLPSLHSMNLEAFSESKPLVSDIHEIVVPYSCYTFINRDGDSFYNHYLKEYANEPLVNSLVTDGFNPMQKQEREAYLFKLIFNTNISGITPSKSVSLHPNILDVKDDWVFKITELKDYTAIKIALLNQGVVIEPKALNYINSNGGIREGVNYAVDLYIGDTIINAPLKTKFVSLSPFHIFISSDKKLMLYYFSHYIDNVKIKPVDDIANHQTSNGVNVKEICFLATDRIRIQHNNFCVFKEENCECKFCDVEKRTTPFCMEDIKQSIDTYLNECKFRHFLIGGRSNLPKYESDEILEITRYIRSKTNKQIYLMCLPPEDLTVLDKYFGAGITEIAFNIEIYDRALAKRYMPGKGSIPIERYITSLKKSVELWGNTGNVRTSFVVGLETTASLLRGIEDCCKIGVTPILSAFRPIPGTALENFIPESNEYLYNLIHNAKMIVKKYGLELGPACKECQNNTLTII